MEDPHIHVERKVAQSGGVRNLIASTFGLVADTPTEVTTGCGIQVPYAMTSHRPESVTCLACREHAHGEFTRMADQMARFRHLPGLNLTPEEVDEAVRGLRDLARRFQD